MVLLPTKAQLIGTLITKGQFRAALGQLIDWANTLGVEAAFAVYANNPNAMSVQVNRGILNNAGTLISQALQIVGGFSSASVNSRIDIVVIDLLTVAASRVAGVESVTPVAPATPAGFMRLAEVGPFTPTTIIITSSMISDQRGYPAPVAAITSSIPSAAESIGNVLHM